MTTMSCGACTASDEAFALRATAYGSAAHRAALARWASYRTADGRTRHDTGCPAARVEPLVRLGC